jgi:hypothetical protein
VRNAPAPSTSPPAGIPRRNAKAPAPSAPRPQPAAGGRRRRSRNAALTVVAPSAFPTRPRLVSSAHGSIRHVLLWYPTHTAADAPAYQRTYGDLLAVLPAATEVTIVAHPKVVKEITALADARRPPASTTTIVKAPASVAFSVWAEDAFVVVDDLDRRPPVTFLLEPERFPRVGDFEMAELVATASPLETAQSPLIFQGGNILIGDDFVFVGADYLDDSVANLEAGGSVEDFPASGSARAQDEFVKRLFREQFDAGRTFHFPASRPAGRASNSIIEIDGERWLETVDAGRGNRQPIFHIDMFLSLAGRAGGKYQVLVGDPGLADRTLGWQPVAHNLQSEFDAIATQLRRLGFSVRRTPLPYVSVDLRGAFQVEVDGAPVEVVGERFWYFATSNNCLVQIDGAAHDVWLPTYGHPPFEELATTDAAHRGTWEALGFTVHQLGDFHLFAMRLGALHCIKKYLAR